MDINLAYVEGISDTNTPSFVAIQNKDDFFLAHRVHVVELSYYAPRYEDTIRISTEIVGMETKFNYLYFTFGTRTYYYFIDNITYINADLIALHIRMDTITTYGSNIKILKGVVERKHINRWKYDNVKQKYVINREYIREDVGSGTFIRKVDKSLGKSVYYKESYALTGDMKDHTEAYVIVKSTVQNAASSPDMRTKIDTNNEFASIVPYSYYIMPVTFDTLYNNYRRSIYKHDGPASSSAAFVNTQTHTQTIKEFVNWANSASGTVSINICYGNFLNKYIAVGRPSSVTDNVYIDNTHFQTLNYDAQGTQVLFPYTTNSTYLNIDDNTTTYNYQALPVKSANITTTFTTYHEPVLFDNQYMYTSILANGKEVPIQYYYINDFTTFSLTYRFNISAFASYLYINVNYDELSQNDAGVYCFKNTFNNIIELGSCEMLPLLNNAWIQYNEYNKYSMMVAYASTAASIGLGAYGAATGGSHSTSSSVTKKAFTLNQGGEKTKIRSTVRKTNTSDSYRDYTLSGSDFGSLIGEGTQMLNAFSAPTTVRVPGDYTVSRYIDDSVHYLYSEVSNLKECAYYFRYYGNLVNINEINITNIYTYCNNRYYFNYLKFSDIDFILTYTINDEAIMDDIRRRLLDGITFFTVRKLSSSPSVYTDLTYNNYDNVENAFIS